MNTNWQFSERVNGECVCVCVCVCASEKERAYY